jgi:hypothetical protein
VACKTFETFNKTFAFYDAKKPDAGDDFMNAQVDRGECKVLPRPVVMLKRGFQYSKIMEPDGTEWWVIAQSVQD